MKDNDPSIQAIRSFNRFYTGLIGLLDGHLLNSDYSLPEARILYEIYAGRAISASRIVSTLGIDKGYLSRILKKFEKAGLIKKNNSGEDARISLLSLSAKGLKVFHTLNSASNDQIETLLQPLTPARQNELVHHMQAIMQILKN